MKQAYLVLPGADAEPTRDELTLRVARNRKRSNRNSSLKREANRMALAAEAHRLAHVDTLTEDAQDTLKHLTRRLGSCSCHSLYREHLAGDQPLEYIGSATCKHKVCPVCNSERSKRLRRKWLTYLTAHPELTTEYDLMHLTLTVPHTAVNGFRGEQFYVMALINIFKELRREWWWKEMVMGGEYGAEVTRNSNGLHFHIHSLVFVYKGLQNRNELHRHILLRWNMLTLDRTAQRHQFGPDELHAIGKGNKTLSPADLACLLPQGSTLVGLESLYTYSDKKRGWSERWDEERKQWKQYVNGKNLDSLMSGVMECLKYHFEPFSLRKHDSDEYDMDLLVDLLPKMKGKPLYQKFGAFRGVKELNINAPKTAAGEAAELLADFAHEEIINPDTLQEAERDEYTYFIASTASVYHFPDTGLRPKIGKNAPRNYIHEARNMAQALRFMIDLSIHPKSV
ncbi:MAG: protein rep [Janthinobacterium lividum]